MGPLGVVGERGCGARSPPSRREGKVEGRVGIRVGGARVGGMRARRPVESRHWSWRVWGGEEALSRMSCRQEYVSWFLSLLSYLYMYIYVLVFKIPKRIKAGWVRFAYPSVAIFL